MAGYVVDTSVIIEYLIQSSFTPLVSGFFARLTEFDRLAVPEFCIMECANVIWKHTRSGEITRSDSDYLLEAVQKLRLRRTPMKRLLARALEIGLNNDLAIYDSAYIAIALNYGYPLLTLDVKQSRVAVAEGVTVIPITNFAP